MVKIFKHFKGKIGENSALSSCLPGFVLSRSLVLVAMVSDLQEQDAWCADEDTEAQELPPRATLTMWDCPWVGPLTGPSYSQVLVGEPHRGLLSTFTVPCPLLSAVWRSPCESLRGPLSESERPSSRREVMSIFSRLQRKTGWGI